MKVVVYPALLVVQASPAPMANMGFQACMANLDFQVVHLPSVLSQPLLRADLAHLVPLDLLDPAVHVVIPVLLAILDDQPMMGILAAPVHKVLLVNQVVPAVTVLLEMQDVPLSLLLHRLVILALLVPLVLLVLLDPMGAQVTLLNLEDPDPVDLLDSLVTMVMMGTQVPKVLLVPQVQLVSAVSVLNIALLMEVFSLKTVLGDDIHKRSATPESTYSTPTQELKLEYIYN